MTIVTEYDFKTNTLPHHDARQAYREAVAAVAAKARTKLPQCTGRIDSAVKLVLAGDVELLPAGGARVASRSDASVQYHTVNGHCDCKDFARAPEGLCSHRLAYGIMRRASELVPQPPPALPEPSVEPATVPAAPAPALPEARCSMNVHVTIAGRQVQVTLRGHDEIEVLTRLETLLDRYPAPASPAATQADATPQCPTHGPMKPSRKGRGHYCPRKMPHGSYCKGR